MQAKISVSLIGAPTDIGAGDRGASMGPEALRVAGLGPALAARGLDVIDRGNVNGPFNPWLPPAGIAAGIACAGIGGWLSLRRVLARPALQSLRDA